MLALLSVAGCSFPHAPLVAGDAANQADATSPDADIVGPFTNITAVAPLDTSAPEDDPTLTADMLEIYFEHDTDIYYSVRTSINEAWPLPMPAEPGINTSSAETTPEISADGLTLTFSSGVSGGYELYMTTRTSRSAAWATPVAMTALNSSYEDYCATFATPTLIYLSSGRPGAGGYDLWRTTQGARTDVWAAPSLVIGLSTADMETEPWVDPTETLIYFTGDGGGTRDLYLATRPDAASAWGPRQAIAELNSDGMEGDAWLSPDGHTIYFSSNRSGDFDIYMATR